MAKTDDAITVFNRRMTVCRAERPSEWWIAGSNERFFMAGKRPQADRPGSDFGLLNHLECIVDFNTEVAHNALKLIDCGL